MLLKANNYLRFAKENVFETKQLQQKAENSISLLAADKFPVSDWTAIDSKNASWSWFARG